MNQVNVFLSYWTLIKFVGLNWLWILRLSWVLSNIASPFWFNKTWQNILWVSRLPPGVQNCLFECFWYYTMQHRSLIYMIWTICDIKLCENKIIILPVLLDQFDKKRNYLFYYSAIMSIKTTSFVFLILQYSFSKFFHSNRDFVSHVKI